MNNDLMMVGTPESAAGNVREILNLKYGMNEKIVATLLVAYTDVVDYVAKELREIGESQWEEFAAGGAYGSAWGSEDWLEDMLPYPDLDWEENIYYRTMELLPFAFNDEPEALEALVPNEEALKLALKEEEFWLDYDVWVEDVVECAGYYRDDTMIWWRDANEVCEVEECR